MNVDGHFYFNGLGGLKEDKAEALAWFKKAADAGDATAMTSVGYFYYKGLSGIKEKLLHGLKKLANTEALRRKSI